MIKRLLAGFLRGLAPAVVLAGLVVAQLPAPAAAAEVGETSSDAVTSEADSPFDWVRQFGTAQYDDVGGMAVGTTGVYAVGRTGGWSPGQSFLRKYDLYGKELWSRDNGTCVAVGADDRIFAGDLGSVRAFDPDGSEVWAVDINDEGYFYHATDISADSGGVYVGGSYWSRGSGDKCGHFVQKCDPNDGHIVWTRRLSCGPGDTGALGVWATSYGVYFAVRDNSLEVAGYPDFGYKYDFLYKYDADGNELWRRVIGLSGGCTQDISADATGVYVAGSTSDAFIRKFDTDGNEVWTRLFGSEASEWVFDISLSRGSIYVAGCTWGVLPGQTSQGGGDVFVCRYDTDGNQDWVRQLGSSLEDDTVAMAVSDSGIYLGGRTYGAMPGCSSQGGWDAYLGRLADSDTLGQRVSTLPASEVTTGEAVLNGQLDAPGRCGLAAVASGYDHALAVGSDGTLWAWGDNTYGQLGLGSCSSSPEPSAVGDSADWVAVSAGADHSLGVRSDGTLWAWGWNGLAQLGLGFASYSVATPTQVGHGTDWVAVSAGYGHSLGLRSDGTLWSWGCDAYGQLGFSAQGLTTDPTRVGSDMDWVMVSAGLEHSLGVRADGTLWTWGCNQRGELGRGNVTSGESTPAQVGQANNWVMVSGGGAHSMGLQSDGSLWAWGDNSCGQLGLGDFTRRTSPTQVGGDTNWVTVCAGGHHSLGLRSDGTLASWGSNEDGQLVPPDSITTCTELSARRHYCLGLLSDGSVWSWGNGRGLYRVSDNWWYCDVYFEWGLTDGYGDTAQGRRMCGSGSFSASIAGLTPGTTYHFRAVAVGDGVSVGGDMTFTTAEMPDRPPDRPMGLSPIDGECGLGVGPTLESSAFSDPDARDTHAASQWQVSRTSAGYTCPVFDSCVDNVNLCRVTVPSGCLDYLTTYYWRVRHQDGRGSWSDWSAESWFTTVAAPSLPPTVATAEATCIGSGSATLNGDLISLGSAENVTVLFVWGTAPGGPYSCETAGAIRTEGGAFFVNLGGLAPGTTYYYRAGAVGDLMGYGAGQSFTTAVFVTPPVGQAATPGDSAADQTPAPARLWLYAVAVVGGFLGLAAVASFAAWLRARMLG